MLSHGPSTIDKRQYNRIACWDIAPWQSLCTPTPNILDIKTLRENICVYLCRFVSDLILCCAVKYFWFNLLETCVWLLRYVGFRKLLLLSTSIVLHHISLSILFSQHSTYPNIIIFPTHLHSQSILEVVDCACTTQFTCTICFLLLSLNRSFSLSFVDFVIYLLIDIIFVLCFCFHCLFRLFELDCGVYAYDDDDDDDNMDILQRYAHSICGLLSLNWKWECK